MLEGLKPFVEAGSVGIALVALGILAFVVKSFIKLVANHMTHNTEAIEKNTTVTMALKTFLETKLK